MTNKIKFKKTEIGLIPDNWNIDKLSNLSKFKYGLGEIAKIKGDIVYIRITDINSDGSLNKNNLKYINMQNVTEEYILKKYDILIARTGATFGKTYLFNEKFEATYGGFLIKLVINKDIIDNNYLYQFTKTKFYWNQTNNLVNGDAQPQFNANSISKLLIPIPSLPEQKAIAKILSDLDEKIELNRKMNQTLEEIGKTLFKRWFVDFEFPNEKGEPYKSSGGEMVYNQELKKEIPKDWSVDKLGNLVDINWGDMNTTKNSYVDVGFPTYSASGLDGQMDHFDYDSKGIILSAIGANCGKTWFASGKWSCIKNTIRIISFEKEVIEYIYFLSNYNSFWPKRGSAQPFISQTDARNISVVIPDENILSIFIKQSSKILNKINKNNLENLKLVTIRESLLPKLMSGKIRVKY